MAELKEPKIRNMRKESAAWRYNEDGTYNNKPSSPTYFIDYYHKKLAVKIACPLCDTVVGMQKLKEHQTSKKCAKRALEKLSSSEEKC